VSAAPVAGQHGAHQPYNRVQLSNLLAGNVRVPEIDIGAELLRGQDPNTRFTSARIEAIDPERKTVTDSSGAEQPYSSLVLATGSAPCSAPHPTCTRWALSLSATGHS